MAVGAWLENLLAAIRDRRMFVATKCLVAPVPGCCNGGISSTVESLLAGTLGRREESTP